MEPKLQRWVQRQGWDRASGSLRALLAPPAAAGDRAACSTWPTCAGRATSSTSPAAPAWSRCRRLPPSARPAACSPPTCRRRWSMRSPSGRAAAVWTNVEVGRRRRRTARRRRVVRRRAVLARPDVRAVAGGRRGGDAPSAAPRRPGGRVGVGRAAQLRVGRAVPDRRRPRELRRLPDVLRPRRAGRAAPSCSTPPASSTSRSTG